METPVKSFQLKRLEVLFLIVIYSLGLFWRLWPRLLIDPYLLTMNADVWERLAMAQYFLDHGRLPEHCLRYLAYGNVPFWYPPLGPIGLAVLAKIFSLDLPTVCSRVIPFIEAFTPISLYFLARWLFGRCTGCVSTIVLALTPSFIYWTGIATPISFTVFLLPLYIILLLIRDEKAIHSPRQRLVWIMGTGALLALNFLIHLTYFFAVAILILIALAVFINTEFQGRKIADFFAAVAVSQIITVFWWAPHNLYLWWVFRLVTSSGYKVPLAQLSEYGLTAGIIAIAACPLYAWKIFRKPQGYTRRDWIPLVWLIVPFIETQNETILRIINRMDLSWYTVFKPLEGFRFFCFLAGPLALIIGWVIVQYVLVRVKRVRLVCGAVIVSLSCLLAADLLYMYKIVNLFNNPGIDLAEYRAALWFRGHTFEGDRIIADYYRAQMFAGVCGGKTLLGGLFPLRNCTLPYVSVPAIVQDDTCTIYTTPDPKKASELMSKYGCNYIFISPLLISRGHLGSMQCNGFGIGVEEKKFEDQKYFTECYNDNHGTRIIRAGAKSALARFNREEKQCRPGP